MPVNPPDGVPGLPRRRRLSPSAVQDVLARFDSQVRRSPRDSGLTIEADERVVRVTRSDEGWRGVVWTNLDDATADASIVAEIERFQSGGPGWEWKLYSYDQPADLGDRLLRHGFVPDPVESVLVAEIERLRSEVDLPDDVTIARVQDADSIEVLLEVHDGVFGTGDRSAGVVLSRELSRPNPSMLGFVAFQNGVAVSAGRLELAWGTEFASIWSGGTLPAWRRRGIYRALVAHRAAVAAAAGFKYLQVDASNESRPILLRLGFVELATTTPFIWVGDMPKATP